MIIILRLIEEKNNQLLDFGGKKEERDKLVEQIKKLDAEIASFDKDKILAEVDELTDCAVKLGLIPDAISEETDDANVTENSEIGV